MKPAVFTPSARNWLVTETVRLIEERGPLDDDQAMREAAGAPGSNERIARRASVLGLRIGLQGELERARHLAPWVGMALTALVVVAGLSVAGSITGETDRRINVLAALASLLGFHLLTLTLWIAGVLLPSRAQNPSRASFGWLWMTVTARVAGGSHGQAPVLLRSALRLLTKARLVPWVMGIASHAIWTLSFLVVLASMLFALAFHRYTLGWETTILDAEFFVRAVRTLGWLPGHMGFPVPDTATILSPSSAALDTPEAQRTLAWWLTGCIAIYGLVPRLLALALCLAIWRSRRTALQPDFAQPYYRRLVARFDAMTPPRIVDPDAGASATSDGARRATRADAGTVSDALVIAAYELPPGHPWPPAGLSALIGPSRPAPTLLDVDGSAPSRRRLLDVAAALRPRRLVLACRAVASPDRATERLLRELLAHCGDCCLWLVGDAGAPDDHEARTRWRQWLSATGLEATATDDLPAALGSFAP